MRTYREALGLNAATWLFRVFFWLWALPLVPVLARYAPSLYRTDVGKLGLGAIGVAVFAWVVLIAPWLALHAAVHYFDDGAPAFAAIRLALRQARLQLALLPFVGRLFASREADRHSSVHPR
jgi:hypothetical protein